MQALKVNKNSPLLAKIDALCNEAFPPEELIAPMKLLEFSQNDDKAEFELLAFLENEDFVGFVALYAYENLAYLAFFAIRADLRGKGYGSKALALLREHRKDRVIVAEIEDPAAPCENREERERRAAFYARAGFKTSGNHISYVGVTYSVLFCGEGYEAATFKAMFDHFSKRGHFSFKFE